MAIDLSGFLVKKATGLTRDLRDKHNDLVHLIANIESSLGINIKFVPYHDKKLHVAKTPKPPNHATKPKGKISIGVNLTAVSVGAGPTNVLHYKDSSLQIDIDGNGIKLINLATGNYVYVYATGFFEIKNSSSGKTLQVDPTLIAHDMSIKTISVCSSGVTKNMDVLGSDPY